MPCIASPSEKNLPLLKPPFLSPTDAYSFIKARTEYLKLTTKVQLLLIYIRGYLLDADLGISSLVAPNLEYRLTSIIWKTIKYLVPEAPPQPQA